LEDIFNNLSFGYEQYKFGTSVSWEGNSRSGVALAMHHRQ